MTYRLERWAVYLSAMTNSTPETQRLFLLVRSHSQIQYYLKLADSKRAANQNGLAIAATVDNVSEIRPISVLTIRRRG
jgi:hypothetical protein